MREKPPIRDLIAIENDNENHTIEELENGGNQSETFKLPKLEASKSLIEENASNGGKMKLRRQTENANVLSRASSAASYIGDSVSTALNDSNETSLRDTIISPSQSFLPKIDSRFLPTNNK